MVFTETYKYPKQIWCYDIKEIEPIREQVSDDVDEELVAILQEGKQVRNKGAFIKHYEFDQNNIVNVAEKEDDEEV